MNDDVVDGCYVTADKDKGAAANRPAIAPSPLSLSSGDVPELVVTAVPSGLRPLGNIPVVKVLYSR